MKIDEVENYLCEIARVLRPGGRCFSTWFLLNEGSRMLMSQGKSALDFRYAVGDALTINPRIPEQAIAFDEGRVRAIHTSHGLVVDDPMRYGHWSGRTSFVTIQDICVARKPS